MDSVSPKLDGPTFSKVGARVVVYDIRDLDEWLQATRRTSTRQEV